MNALDRPDTAPAPTGFHSPRRAKIVATLGPACSTPEVFRNLVRAGVDVARLNFSHGSHAQKAELIQMVRADLAGRAESPYASLPTCRVRRSAPVN